MKRSQILILVGLLSIVMLSIILLGCSDKTYTGKIGEATYSFKYRSGHPVNPPHPFSSNQIGVNPLSPEYFISIISHPGGAIETSLGIYRIKQDPQELNKFKILGRETITIAGIPAEHVMYTYEGYTTIPVTYFGDFVHFKYKYYTVEIHVLFPGMYTPFGNVGEAFDLLVKTFKIEE